MQTFIFFMYKIPTKFLTELSWRHTNCVTPWHHTFVSQQGRFNYIVYCIVFARQDAIIFMSIPVVLGVYSTDSCCSTIWTVIQMKWPAFCASNTLVSILHTFYKKETGINMTSRHSMLHLIQHQASASFGYMLLWLQRRNSKDKEKKLLRVVAVVMQSDGGLDKNWSSCCPIRDLIESCFSFLTCPILNLVVTLGWRLRHINKGVGPAEKVAGPLHSQKLLIAPRRKRSRDLRKRKYIDWDPETEYWQVWRY
jgi:hypothetical protein